MSERPATPIRPLDEDWTYGVAVMADERVQFFAWDCCAWRPVPATDVPPEFRKYA